MRKTVRMGQIRQEIPDELHRRLRIQAATEGVPLKELIIRLLAEGLETRKDKQ